MSSFLFGDRKKRTRIAISQTTGGSGAEFEAIELEATLQESFTGTAAVTDHPVEDGADITDHIRRQPETLELRGIVSNYPLVVLSSARARPIQPGGDPSQRAEEAFAFLRDLKDRGQTVDVSTTLSDYFNFAITSISVTRDKDSRQIVDLSISLREIQIARTEQVAAPATKEPQRKGRSSKGRKPKTTPPAPAAQKSQSILAGLFGG